MPKIGVTSPADFKLFCEEVKKWQVRLGLLDWRIDFFHQNAVETVGATRGWFEARDGFVCNIGLALSWGEDEVTKEKVKETALHETLHIILAEMCWLADQRFLPQGLLEIEEHRIIRRFETCLTALDRKG